MNTQEQKEIILNRLTKQYKKYSFIKETKGFEKVIEKREYFTLRKFCLDCSLLTFNEIELLEFEVNHYLS